MNIVSSLVSSSDLKMAGLKLCYYVEDTYLISKKYREERIDNSFKIIIFRDKIKPRNIISDDYIFAENDEEAKNKIENIIKNNIQKEINFQKETILRFEKSILNRNIVSSLIRKIRNKVYGYNDINMLNEIKKSVSYMESMVNSDLKIDFHFSNENSNKKYIVPENYKDIIHGITLYCSYFNMGEKNGIVEYKLQNLFNDTNNGFNIDLKEKNKGIDILSFDIDAEFKKNEESESEIRRVYMSYEESEQIYKVSNRYSGHSLFDSVQEALNNNLNIIEKMKEKAESDAKLILSR